MQFLVRTIFVLFLVWSLFLVEIFCNSHKKNPIQENPSPEEEETAEPDTASPLLLVPYKYQSEMASINEAYSESPNCPWRFKHQGIDFFPKQDLALFQAVTSGEITYVERFYNEHSKKWQVNLELRINSVYVARYAFEPGATLPSQADTQMAHIFVQKGERVSPGQELGRLLVRAEGAHVDFGFFKNQVPICPEPYFTQEARDSILVILHRRYPGASICYE